MSPSRVEILSVRAVRVLGREWLEDKRPSVGTSSKPGVADRAQLSCLYASQEVGLIDVSECRTTIEDCVSIAMDGDFGELDALPWNISLDFINERKIDRDRLLHVERLLGHHDSSVRWWFHHVAWAIRHHINGERVQDTLLQNVADKLGAVRESMGLASYLRDDDVEFMEAVLGFTPESFEAQYKRRTEGLDISDWMRCQYSLVSGEAECWRHITKILIGESHREHDEAMDGQH